jgi:hypothetical protein
MVIRIKPFAGKPAPAKIALTLFPQIFTLYTVSIAVIFT